MSRQPPHRRQHPRVAFAGPLVVRLAGGHEGWLRDLSATGARLEHDGLLRSGDACLLQLTLNDEPFTVSGRVVWSRATGRAGRGRLESGIRFEQVPGAAQPLLAQVLGEAGTRVLVVEDDPAVREVLATGLLHAGYAVHEAGDGRDGLALAQQLVPDVILLDVRMADLDGYEVCRALKANPVTTRIPVIFVTAVEDPALHARATAAGATACLTKPFRFEALLALTRTVLATARRA